MTLDSCAVFLMRHHEEAYIINDKIGAESDTRAWFLAHERRAASSRAI
jgi:hypothetical protein